jgi:hypothetical protein
MAEQPGIESIGGLLPSVYYDVIARVLPGVAFIETVVRMRHWSLGMEPESAAFILAALGAGYIVGMSLSLISGLIFNAITAVLRLAFVVLAAALRRIAPRHAAPLKDVYCPAFFSQIGNKADRIAEKNWEAGTLVSKMLAESMFFQNLFSGTLIVWALGCDARTAGDCAQFGRLIPPALALFMAGALGRLMVAQGRAVTLERIYARDPAQAAAATDSSAMA